MSFTQMAKAKPIKVGNSGRKLVLMMLADISDDSGRCFPSYQHLADVCEMSRRSVITHISKLEEDGYLKVTHRKLKGELLNSSNIYHLILKSAANTDETCGENSALGGEMVSLGSENSALGGSENSAPITYHSSYPIKEPIKTKARFIKPSVEEVAQYMFDHGEDKNLTVNPISDADQFHDYYESNGWKVGKNSMENWQATARSWIGRNQDKQPVKTVTNNSGYNDKQIKNQRLTHAVLNPQSW